MLQHLFSAVLGECAGWVGRGGAELGGTIELSSSFCVSAASLAPSIPLPIPGGAGGEERVGDAQQRVQPSPGGYGAVSLNTQRSQGQRAANAFPWHRGRRGCGPWGSRRSSGWRQSRARISVATAPRQHPRHSSRAPRSL